jgi:hypothetical protein
MQRFVSAVLLRVAVSLLPATIAGCAFVDEAVTRLPGPRLYEHGAEVIGSLRAFERRIGFKDTNNFANLAEETEAFPFCGYVSSLYLPYSYEDPAIHWNDTADSEEACRRVAGPNMDVYFGQTEALGEVGTPVTPSMLAGTLVRFVYLVIHEDCHDQFDLPLGIEEALCNVITYHAMVAYAAEQKGTKLLERVAMRRYAERESERTRAAKAFYEQLQALYARFDKGELSVQALLEQRAKIFAKAERALAWNKGHLNNVGIANDMTYSRHFPFLEEVFEALGRDLAKTVAFFKRVDAAKPSRAAVLKRLRLADERSLEFIRAYEEAVLDTIRRELAAVTGGGAAKK